MVKHIKLRKGSKHGRVLRQIKDKFFGKSIDPLRIPMKRVDLALWLRLIRLVDK